MLKLLILHDLFYGQGKHELASSWTHKSSGTGGLQSAGTRAAPSTRSLTSFRVTRKLRIEFLNSISST